MKTKDKLGRELIKGQIKGQSLIKLRNVILFSLGPVLVIGIVFFFILDRKVFWGVVFGEAISFLLFVTTLISYYYCYMLKRREASKRRILRFILGIFFGKIIFVGIIFYVLTKFDFLSLLSLIVSFLLLFTVFLNLVIFLTYKKILFR